MRIVFERIPAATGPDVLNFVEVEDHTGVSIDAGDWADAPINDKLTYRVLIISPEAHITALASSLLDLEHRNALERLLSQQETPRAWQRLTPDEVEALNTYRKAKPSHELPPGYGGD